MRNRFLTGGTLTALLASGPAPLPIVAAQAAAPGWNDGFCRNAEPLPQLDSETRPRPVPATGGKGGRYDLSLIHI